MMMEGNSRYVVWIGGLREGEGEVINLVLVFLGGLLYFSKERDCRDKERNRKQGSSSYTNCTNR